MINKLLILLFRFRFLLFCFFLFLSFVVLLTIPSARAQVPTVDPQSVTTPTPTPVPYDPNASNNTPQSEPTAIVVTNELFDELSLKDELSLDDELAAAEEPPPDLMHGFNRTRYYTVRPEDTLLSVALESGINLDEMWCVVAPTFTGREPLVIGDILEIPPPDIACHQVAEGEMVSEIAEQYEVLAEEIVADPWNELDFNGPDVVQPLPAGIHLRVPLPIDPATAGEELLLLLTQPVGKSLPTPMMRINVEPITEEIDIPDSWPFGSGYFRWPVSGWLSQGYHGRHRALDIASPLGTVVTAADRGVVIRAGWNRQGYGNLVIVDHKNDFLTLYAHLSEILVEAGQIVSAGEVIGEIGSTGNSTGPHLHFEIRDYGKLVDPLVMLTR